MFFFKAVTRGLLLMIAHGSNHIIELTAVSNKQLDISYLAIKTQVIFSSLILKTSFSGLVQLHPFIHISHTDFKLTLD